MISSSRTRKHSPQCLLPSTSSPSLAEFPNSPRFDRMPVVLPTARHIVLIHSPTLDRGRSCCNATPTSQPNHALPGPYQPGSREAAIRHRPLLPVESGMLTELRLPCITIRFPPVAVSLRVGKSLRCYTPKRRHEANDKNETAERMRYGPCPSALEKSRRPNPKVALPRATTCIRRASRVISSCCVHRVLPGVRNDAERVCPARVHPSHPCEEDAHAPIGPKSPAFKGRALCREIYASQVSGFVSYGKY